jgi:hypothetical protein
VLHKHSLSRTNNKNQKQNKQRRGRIQTHVGILDFVVPLIEHDLELQECATYPKELAARRRYCLKTARLAYVVMGEWCSVRHESIAAGGDQRVKAG